LKLKQSQGWLWSNFIPQLGIYLPVTEKQLWHAYTFFHYEVDDHEEEPRKYFQSWKHQVVWK